MLGLIRDLNILRKILNILIVSRREYQGVRSKINSEEEIGKQRRRLPIYQFKEQFINAVRFNQVVVVVGETGSGKSTQMPQYLLGKYLIEFHAYLVIYR